MTIQEVVDFAIANSCNVSIPCIMTNAQLRTAAINEMVDMRGTDMFWDTADFKHDDDYCGGLIRIAHPDNMNSFGGDGKTMRYSLPTLLTEMKDDDG
jgi:hypothetical protein